MALQQNNRNQSRVRVNLSNILGLSEEQQRIIAQNYNRIYGGYHAVYFNGATAASETANIEPTCQECSKNPDPNKPPKYPDDDGGGGGGDDDNILRPPSCNECVSLSQAVEMMKKGQTPCCVQGIDCKTGESVDLNLKKDYPEYPPRPPECDEEHRTKWARWGSSSSYCGNGSQYEEEGCFTFEQFQGFVQRLKGIVDSQGGEVCRDTDFSEHNLRLVWIGAVPLNYSIHKDGGGSYGFHIGAGTNNKCQAPKKYGMVNGKMVNLCDPYSEPEEDCKTLCDENGKKYTVCTNNGQPNIQEVA